MVLDKAQLRTLACAAKVGSSNTLTRVQFANNCSWPVHSPEPRGAVGKRVRCGAVRVGRVERERTAQRLHSTAHHTRHVSIPIWHSQQQHTADSSEISVDGG